MFKLKRNSLLAAAVMIMLSLLGSRKLHGQMTALTVTSLSMQVSASGTNEPMGEVAFTCLTPISAYPYELAIAYSAPVTSGTGMMTSSLPFLVPPERSQSGSTLIFRFTPSAGMCNFVVRGIGANASVAGGGAIYATVLGYYPLTFSNPSVQVAVLGTNPFIKGRIDTPIGLSGAPGNQVQIPVTLTLNAGVNADTASFQLDVIPDGLSPGLTGTLSFNKNASLPNPAVDTSEGPQRIRVTWAGGLGLSGTIVLGNVILTIPPQAYGNHSYILSFSSSSFSYGGGPVSVWWGPTNKLSVNAPLKKRRGQTLGQ